jgi:polyisoprenoid-binding protein YceI
MGRAAAAMMRYLIDPEASRVWIKGSSSVHPIHAEANGLSGWLSAHIDGGRFVDDDITGHVEIAVDQLASGNELVDRETQRRIDAKHHPLITGDIAAVVAVSNDVADITGVIGFRGQDVEASGTVGIESAGDRLVVEGAQTLDVRRWGLKPPRFLVMRVHPEIEVAIRLELVPDAG